MMSSASAILTNVPQCIYASPLPTTTINARTHMHCKIHHCTFCNSKKLMLRVPGKGRGGEEKKGDPVQREGGLRPLPGEGKYTPPKTSSENTHAMRPD